MMSYGYQCTRYHENNWICLGEDVSIEPNIKRFAEIVNLDETKEIRVDERKATSASGISAFDDLRMSSERQVASAAGDSAAALYPR